MISEVSIRISDCSFRGRGATKILRSACGNPEARKCRVLMTAHMCSVLPWGRMMGGTQEASKVTPSRLRSGSAIKLPWRSMVVTFDRGPAHWVGVKEFVMHKNIRVLPKQVGQVSRPRARSRKNDKRNMRRHPVLARLTRHEARVHFYRRVSQRRPFVDILGRASTFPPPRADAECSDRWTRKRDTAAPRL
jgi:hypothetical protein